MRSRVSGRTSGLLRSARETVAWDTCASCAISSDVNLGVFTALDRAVDHDVERAAALRSSTGTSARRAR